MHLFDSHCHLQDQRILKNINGILSRAVDAGVAKMVCCGSSEDDWEQVLDIYEKNRGLIIPAFGIHPWYVAQRSELWLDKLKEILKRVPGSAVGEIGLDHALESRNDSDQLLVFTQQLELAAELKRPVSIHCRKAWGDLLNTIEKIGGVKYGGAIHSFSGAPGIVEQLEKYNLCISFSGSITYERNKKARESCRKVSSNRLLIETDSPDIRPYGFEFPENEPSALRSIAESVAMIRNSTVEETAKITYANGLAVFDGNHALQKAL
jgi:TatD DNase family protein